MAMAPHRARAAAAAAALALAALLILSSLPALQASLPPVSCDEASGSCTVVSAYREWPDRKPCRFSQVLYPASEEELVAAVAAAVRSKKKVRVVSKWAHSIPKLVCPAGDDGVLISTRDLNATIIVDREALTVTADAGVMLKDLVEILAEKGVALSHVPYWSGLSIAGLLSTGAHGSSLWGKGSAVHEYLTSLRIVVPATADEGYAAVKTLSDADSEQFAAAKVSLGVLEAISQVTLQVEPLFKRSLSFEPTGDADLESRMFQLAEEEEFGDLSWRPAQGQVGYRHDKRVPSTTAGDGAYDFIQPLPVPYVQAARAAVLAREASRDGAGKCAAAADLLEWGASVVFFSVNNRSSNVFEGYPVVGFTHHIQTSGRCSEGPQDVDNPDNPLNKVCAFFDLAKHKGTFVNNVAVSVPMSRIRDVLADLRLLAKKRPLAFCEVELSSFGLLMRFVKGQSSAFLGVAEDAVDIDFFFMRADEAETPRLDEDVFEEVEQILLFKYRGLPHWGKNRPFAFAGVAAKYPRIGEFLRVREELDPEGLFSNEWTDAVLGIGGDVTTVKPFCALEGLCVCSEDVHCAPEAGYFCRPGLVYREARVCRFEESDDRKEEL